MLLLIFVIKYVPKYALNRGTIKIVRLLLVAAKY